MGEIEIEVVDGGSASVRWAMEQYFAELHERFTDGFDPGDALEQAGELFNPPQGTFLLAILDGAPVGCGAVQLLDGETAEIKRMWVGPTVRGRGLGRRLLGELERVIAESGRSRVLLDTNATLDEAIAMYRSSGYSPTERYNDNPYAQLWFEKTLTTAGSITPAPAPAPAPGPGA